MLGLIDDLEAAIGVAFLAEFAARWYYKGLSPAVRQGIERAIVILRVASLASVDAPND